MRKTRHFRKTSNRFRKTSKRGGAFPFSELSRKNKAAAKRTLQNRNKFYNNANEVKEAIAEQEQDKINRVLFADYYAAGIDKQLAALDEQQAALAKKKRR